jgi:hypothetical protein
MMLESLEDEDLLELERQIYRDSLYKTARYLLNMKDINWRTHGEMIEALEDLEFRKSENTNALIIMPRGSLKSSVSSVAFPVWRLIRDRNKRILIDSATYDLSTLLVGECAQYLESEPVTRLFGSFRSKDDWSSKSITVSGRTRILKESSIVASGVGSPKTGAHYDCILMDDLNNEKNSATPELMEKVVKHYQMNYAILEPDGDSAVVATRYAALDVPGHILTNEIGDDMLPGYLRANG